MKNPIKPSREALAILLVLFTVAPVASGAGKLTSEQKKFLKKTVDVNADDLDCAAVRKKVMDKLGKQELDNNAINKECQNNLNKLANKKDIKSGQGYCQNTYQMIAGIAEGVKGHVNKFCEVVNQAKALGKKKCDNQAQCLQDTKAKFAEAGIPLDEAVKLLSESEKRLQEAQEENRAAADRYKSDLLLMAQQKALNTPEANVKSTNWFGDSVSGLYQKYAWWADPKAPVENYERAWDADPTTEPDPSKLPPEINEQVNASKRAREAAHAASELKSDITSFHNVFNKQIGQIGSNADHLSSIPSDPSPTAQGSRITQAATSPSLTQAASRSFVANPLNPENNVGVAANLPENQNSSATRSPASQSAPAPIAAAKISQIGAVEAKSGAAEKSAPTGEKKADEENEIVKTFKPIGNGKFVPNVEAEIRALASEDAAADKINHATATGGNAAAISDKSKSNSVDSSSSDEKTGRPNGSAAVLAGGKRGTSSFHAESKEKDAAAAKPGGDSSKLRELLRRRLAERGAMGEDINASRTVEEIMENLSSPANSPADASNSSLERSGGGPQGADGEPLFRRVHDAHQRFELRTSPHHAGN